MCARVDGTGGGGDGGVTEQTVLAHLPVALKERCDAFCISVFLIATIYVHVCVCVCGVSVSV